MARGLTREQPMLYTGHETKLVQRIIPDPAILPIISYLHKGFPNNKHDVTVENVIHVASDWGVNPYEPYDLGASALCTL